MFSAFGLGGDQNNTTFNGLGSGVGSLPPDAQVRVTFSQFPADPARGGFSGAQINVQSVSRFQLFVPWSERLWNRSRSPVDGPGRRFVGAKVDDAAFRREACRPDPDGPGVLQRLVFRAANVRRHVDAVEHESDSGYSRPGVASDSAARLIGILRAQGGAGLDRQRSNAARDRQSQLPNEHRLHAQLVGHGELAHARACSAVTFTCSRRAAACRCSRERRRKPVRRTGGRRRPRCCTRTISGSACSRRRRSASRSSSSRRLRISTSRPGTCASASRLPDGTTSIKTLVVRRRCAAERSVESSRAAQEPAAVVQQRQQAHYKDHVERLTRAQYIGRRTRRSARSRSIRSPTSRPACRRRTRERCRRFIFRAISSRPASRLATLGVRGARSKCNTACVPTPTASHAAQLQRGGARYVRHSQRRRAEPHQLQPARWYAVDLRHRADRRLCSRRGAAAARGDSRGRRHLSERRCGEPALRCSGADRIAGIDSNDCVRRTRRAGSELELVFARSRAAFRVRAATTAPAAYSRRAAPSVVAYDRRFEQPRSLRTAADWSSPILDNRYVLGIQGVYSWNMNQPGGVDINLDPAARLHASRGSGTPGVRRSIGDCAEHRRRLDRELEAVARLPKCRNEQI